MATARESGSGGRGAGRAARGVSFGWLAATIGLALGVAVVYASTYSVHRFQVPLGWDTSYYAWITNAARSAGAANLPSALPPPGPAHAGRVGVAVLAALLSSITHVHPYRISLVLPGVMAAAAGLAGAAFTGRMFHQSRWEFVLTAVAVGTSIFLVRVIDPEVYQDESLAAAVFMAAATPVVLAARDRRSVVPAAVLLGALGLIHWNFFEAGAGIVLAVAVVFVPASFRAWRSEGRRILDTSSARLSLAVLGGAALALATILLVLTASLPSALLISGQLTNKLRRDLPSYHLPLVIAATLAGAAAVGRAASEETERGERVRVALVLLVAWSEVIFLGYVAQRTLGRPVPTHRLLAFDLGLPILGIIGVLWAARWVGRRGGREWRWRPVAAAGAALAVGASAYLSIETWFSFRPVIVPAQVRQAASAAAYLDRTRVSPDRPVVFVIEPTGGDEWSFAWVFAQTVRGMMQPERLEHVYLFVGDPRDYLARRAASSGSGSTASLSQFYFARMARTYDEHPVALVLSSANPGFGEWVGRHEASVAAPGVAVVRGPPPGGPERQAPAPVGAVGSMELVGLAGAAVVVLVVAGSGWTGVLLGHGVGPRERAALAPAVGAAVLVLGGAVLNRVGIPLSGPGSVAIVLVVGMVGWVPQGLRSLTARRT